MRLPEAHNAKFSLLGILLVAVLFFRPLIAISETPENKALSPTPVKQPASSGRPFVSTPRKATLQAKRLDPEANDPSARGSLRSVGFLPQKGGVFADQLKTNLLYVSEVKVTGNYRLSESQVRELSGLSTSPGFWQVDIAKIRQHLLQSPWIESAEVQTTLYPASLTIHVKEAELWFIAEYEQHSWLVSRTGKLIQSLDTLDNPDIILETTELQRLDGLNMQVGSESYLSSANARFLQAVNLMKLFEAAGEYPFEIERFTFLPGGGMKLTPSAASYPQVLLSAENLDDAVLRLKRLKSVLADLDRRSEKPKRIDLRFHSQAIVE